MPVATVLTVYGIETYNFDMGNVIKYMLQQYLPFTVLKQKQIVNAILLIKDSCNSTYRLRY